MPRFIVFEGLDGSGTSTQSALLKNYLGPNCFLDQEPSNGYIGLMLREILEKKNKVNPITLLQLFLADRVDHQKVLLDKLREGNQVIFTRYILSTLAYQGMHFELEDLYQFNKNFQIPDYTFYLDIDPKTSLIRKEGGKDLFENFDALTQVKENYEKAIDYLTKKGWNIIRLNAFDNKELIHETIVKIITQGSLI